MSAHTVWGGMMSRCYDPGDKKYPRYGGRGIRVCDRWICRKLFLEDMAPKPEGMSLNRIDNDGPYAPENCEWANPRTQAQNRRDTRNITHLGATHCLTEWSRITGLRRETIRNRLDTGWTVESALTTPLIAGRPHPGINHESRYIASPTGHGDE